jgi:hypothetical protein
MERESFRNRDVAALLNESFVCVKVDREERPDIDAVYMDAALALGGAGGWPLTVMVTPSGRPFFAATYIPRESSYGRTGLLDLLPEVARLWRDEREVLEDTAAKLEKLLSTTENGPQNMRVGDDLHERALQETADSFDDSTGSFGRAPLFPQPHRLLFLLDFYQRTGRKRALQMAESSLWAMRMGGIYDNVGGGFHRYSTDGRWLVPHFEKMLYDQALMCMAYTEGYRLTSDPLFETTVEGIIGFVLDEMTTEEGGFMTALDADAEGEEGGFYTWTHGELRNLLTAGQMDLAQELLGVRPNGNVSRFSGLPAGSNVIHLTRPPKSGETEALSELLSRLFQARKERPRPFRDDKVLADCSGLMVGALARAGRVFDRQDWISAAGRGAELILGAMRDEEGRLLHSYRGGRASIVGMLDDYAFLGMGLIELYLSTLEGLYLKHARRLLDHTLEHFKAPGEGMFRTADYSEKLLHRQVPTRDGSSLSGNSVTLWNAAMLARLTEEEYMKAMAAELSERLLRRVADAPSASGFLLLAAAMANPRGSP